MISEGRVLFSFCDSCDHLGIRKKRATNQTAPVYLQDNDETFQRQ